MLNTPATLKKYYERNDIRVQCMNQHTGTNILVWKLEHRDICWIPIQSVLCPVEPPEMGRSAKHYYDYL